MGAGACVGSTVQFVPSLYTPGITAAEEAALAVCRRCPGVDERLAYVLAHGEDGVWGDRTEAERRTMR